MSSAHHPTISDRRLPPLLPAKSPPKTSDQRGQKRFDIKRCSWHAAAAILLAHGAIHATELPPDFRAAATDGFRRQAQIVYVAPPSEATRTAIPKVASTNGEKSTLDKLFVENKTRVLVVARGGGIFYERYSFGVGKNSTPLGFSISKSLTALTVGHALCEGKISSVDDVVKQYVPALAGTSWGESRIRDVLRMASGANSTQVAFHGWSTRETGEALDEIYFGRLRIDYLHFLQRDDDRRFSPGALFNYNNLDTIVLGLLVEQATSLPFPTYFEQTVWRAAGAESRGAWLVNGKKQTATYVGFSATPHDWVRVGLMVLRELKNPTSCTGKFVSDAVSMQISALGPAPGYGYQIWPNCAPKVDFCFIGFGGQYLLFNIEHEVVVYHHAITTSPAVLTTPYVMEALLAAMRSK